MSGGATAFQGDPKIDLYKLRAAEYRERYESMRDLEWKVLFQTYAGYAGIAAAVAHIHGLQWYVPRRMMIGTFIFFLATQYLSIHIQERLINFDATYESWIKQLYPLVGIDPKFDPGPGTKNLWHKYTWTYHTQLLLACLTSMGLLSYEAGLPHEKPRDLLIVLNVLIVIFAVILGCHAEWRRRKSRGQRISRESGTPATDRT
jgi:hypothetical protein